MAWPDSLAMPSVFSAGDIWDVREQADDRACLTVVFTRIFFKKNLFLIITLWGLYYYSQSVTSVSVFQRFPSCFGCWLWTRLYSRTLE